MSSGRWVFVAVPWLLVCRVLVCVRACACLLLVRARLRALLRRRLARGLLASFPACRTAWRGSRQRSIAAPSKRRTKFARRARGAEEHGGVSGEGREGSGFDLGPFRYRLLRISCETRFGPLDIGRMDRLITWVCPGAALFLFWMSSRWVADGRPDV